MLATPPAHAPNPAYPKIPFAHAPTPAYPKIPFATLPSFLKNTLPWNLSVLSALALVVFLIWDVCLSCKRNKYWVPGHHLILGALCLQLVGSVDYLVLSISDERKLDQTVVKQLSEDILNKQVVFCGERALLCVFVGVILPQISTSRAQRRLSDLFALLIIVFTVSFHMIYEAYVLILQGKKTDQEQQLSSMLFFKLNPFIELTTLVLLISLILAYGTSKRIQEFVAYKTPKTESALGSWENVEEQVLRSWITALTSQPEYIIARSIFSASTGFLVTVCVVLFALASLNYPLGTGLIVLISQWSFISVGWVIVCWRWVTAVVYNSRPKGMKDLRLRTYFWIRVCCNLPKVPMEWSLYSIISMFRLSVSLFVWMLLEMVWFISGMVFCNCCIRRLVMGNKGYNEFTKLKLCNNVTENSDFEKFCPALMHMPWENPKGLWTANRESIEKAKEQFKKGRSNAHKGKALLFLPETETWQDQFAFPSEVESGFRFRKGTAKMTVVTLLTVIIELSTWYDELNGLNKVILKECIDACQNAWKILELVEKKDPETALVNAVADRLFLWLTKRQPRWLGLPLPFNEFRTRDVEAVRAVRTVEASLQELVNKGKQMLNGGVTDRGYESLNCTASIAIENLEQVCNSINNWINQSLGNNSLEDMLRVIQIWLANVIRSSVLKAKDCVLEECRIEANADMEKEEEKLWNVLYVVGIAKEITEMLQLDAVELHTSRSMEDVICPWIILCKL